MDSDTLYQKIRLDFFQKVYSGELLPDQQLPPERKQAEELSVSRGTIRKARNILEADGYIANTQGSGAVYTPLKTRSAGSSGIIAVVCPVHNPFFMSYYRAFEREAETRDMVVMIKQLDSSNATGLERVLFSLFLKGIRDIVIWPYDADLKEDYLRRLGGLGMNIIFFDTGYKGFDSVSVDNAHGIESLYRELKKEAPGPAAYIGWDSLSSTREREKRFLDLKEPDDLICRLPWNQENLTPELLAENREFCSWLKENRTEGFICGNGQIGTAVKKFLLKHMNDHRPVYSMDNFEESKELGLTVYEQPFEAMGKKSLQLLLSGKGEERRAEAHYIKGRIIKR